MNHLDQELATMMAPCYDSNSQPREGFFNLTRRMENEDEDQLNVDLTIFDWLLYKATSAVFEWQARADKYESDLPNALITMTAATSNIHELTAARANLGDDWQPTSDWFDLAGQFMLQAVIDQYTINGHCQTETLTEIFAFGNPGAECEGGGPDIAVMRNLFCKDGSPSEELPEWTATRRKYITESNAIHDLEKIEARQPYVKFEDNLLSFLQHLHDSAIRPDLIQVEEGRINIDGNELSEVESREMIERMKLS